MALSLLALLLSVTCQSNAGSVSFVEVASTATSIPRGVRQLHGLWATRYQRQLYRL